jgi:hypothetical protein
MWIVAIAIVAALGVLAFMALTGDSEPTVTFDGESLVYDGPATFEAGEHTFVFDASAYETDAAFAFHIDVIKDLDMTDAQIEASESSVWRQPEFIGRSKAFWILEDAEDRILEETFELEPDTRYGVFVLERGGDEVFFASTFVVE